ncbi:MAG TPA: response regulator [Candidatus Saccharimonadales bacterium]|nr:response regulator [Candidatus Saccharimonadales bacterium]
MSKIMLVEDDNSLREIYQARLAAEGYEIVTAQDGEEALALVGKEKPDLIILDVMMPKISGFDTLDIIRSTPNTKDIKVIMMTALSQAEDKARAEKLGADRYLVKSQVTLEDIVKAAKEVIAGDGTAQASTSDPNASTTPTEGNNNMSILNTPPSGSTTPDPMNPSPSSDSTVPPASASPAPDNSLNITHPDDGSDPASANPATSSDGSQSSPTTIQPLSDSTPSDPPASQADAAVTSDPNPLDNKPGDSVSPTQAPDVQIPAPDPTPPSGSTTPDPMGVAPAVSSAEASASGATPSTPPIAAMPNPSADSSTPDADKQQSGGQRVIQPLDNDPGQNTTSIDTLLANEALRESASTVPPPPTGNVIGSDSGVTVSEAHTTPPPADDSQPSTDTPVSPAS